MLAINVGFSKDSRHVFASHGENTSAKRRSGERHLIYFPLSSHKCRAIKVGPLYVVP